MAGSSVVRPPTRPRDHACQTTIRGVASRQRGFPQRANDSCMSTSFVHASRSERPNRHPAVPCVARQRGGRLVSTRLRLAVAAVLSSACVLPSLVVAPSASAAPTATVMVKTQRMSDATLNSRQVGWYEKGVKLGLTCSKRGQSVKGFFSFNIPNGGWDNLWYRVSDGYFVADVDIEIGTLNPVAPACGTPAPAPPAPAASPGRKMGQTKKANTGAPGYCTWGAYEKWFQASGRRYYPALSGNAKQWANAARRTGWTVVTDAQPRSIVVFQPGVHGAHRTDGHVAWVDSTSRRADGVYVTVTEMNGSAGWNRWSSRTSRTSSACPTSCNPDIARTILRDEERAAGPEIWRAWPGRTTSDR